MAFTTPQTEEAKLILSVTDEATKTLAKVEKTLRGLTTTTEKADTQARQMSDGMSQMALSFTRGILPVVSLAAAIRGIRAAWEFAEAGIDDRRVETRFVALAGSADMARERLQDLQRASEGAIETTELQRASVLLDRIGIKATESQAAIVSFARQYARENNRSLTEVLGQVTAAFKSGSGKAFAGLGVRLNDKQIVDDYAASLGLTAAQLSRAQKAAAVSAAAVLDLGGRAAYATREINGMEQAATGWANAVSTMQRTWADFLDPVAAARAQGAAGGLSVQGILGNIQEGDLDAAAQRMQQIVGIVKSLQEEQERLSASQARQESEPLYGPMLKTIPTGTNMAVEQLEIQRAAITGKLDALRTDLGERRKQLQEALGAIQTGLEGFAQKGAPLGQQFGATFREVAASAESLRAMGELAAAVGWTEIAADLGRLQAQALSARDALARIMEQQAEVQQMDLSGYRALGRELERLTALGSRATDADRERSVEMKAQAEYYKSLHSEALKAVGSLDQWAGAADLSLASTKALREAQQAWTEATKIATAGEGDLAAALVRVEQAIPGQAAALREMGLAQSEVNIVLDAAADKLAFLRQGLDGYLRSLETMPGIVAPTGLGLDPEALKAAQREAQKTFAVSDTTGAAPQEATQELLVRARIARGEIQDEVAQALALTQAQLADLQAANYAASKLEAERVLIVKAGADELARIAAEKQADQDAANMAQLESYLQQEQQARANNRALRDAELERLALLGYDISTLQAQRAIYLDQLDGSISAELAAERSKTAALKAEQDQRRADMQAYKDATINSLYALNDAQWKIGQMQTTDQNLQEMQRKTTALSAVSAEFAQASFQIAESSRARAAADREATQAASDLEIMKANQALFAEQDIAQQQQVIAALTKASQTANASLGAGIGGAIAGIGGIVAVFADGAREAAATLAAFSAAGAVLAAAFGAYSTAAQLGIAAGMFTAIALTSPSKKKSSAPEIASMGLAAPTQGGGEIVININMTEGVVYGTPQEIGENIIRSIRGARYGAERLPRGLIE